MRIGATTVLSVATILLASGGAAAVNLQVLDQSINIRFDREGLGGIAPSAKEIEVDESGIPVAPTTDATQDSNQNVETTISPEPTSTKKSSNSGSNNRQQATQTPTAAEPDKTNAKTIEPTEETSEPKVTKSKKEKDDEDEDDDDEDEDEEFEDEDD